MDILVHNNPEDSMKRILLAAVAAATLGTAGAAYAQMAPTKMGTTSKGQVLTDAKGMTLYTFDKDAGGKSACNGPCAGNWPPLMASADAKPAAGYAVVARNDGSKQWAYKGKPLYTWKNDHKPGDITGDGFLNNNWHIAKP
jgi:predicted lipoprotein with Yx(FWY)xxD motif